MSKRIKHCAVTPWPEAVTLRAKYAKKHPGKNPKEQRAIDFWVKNGTGPRRLPEEYRRVSFCVECGALMLWKSVLSWMRAWVGNKKSFRLCEECR